MNTDILDSLLEKCAFSDLDGYINCAVSGGADSVALLILASIYGLKVTVYHVDHSIRETGKEEAQFVENLAKRFNAGFEMRTINVTVGPNLEARLRAERFRALPIDISLGHTMDDQAETVLLRLMRGSGSKGLGAMEYGRKHPILRLRRKETEFITDLLEIKPLSDPTNQSNRFKRNRVRNELIPLMNNIAERDVVPIVARIAELLKEDDALLESISGTIDAEDIDKIGSYPKPLSNRALRNFLSTSYPPSSKDLEKVWKVIRKEIGATELPGGRRVAVAKNRLKLY